MELAAEDAQIADLAVLLVQRLEDQGGKRLGVGRLERDALIAQEVSRLDLLAGRRGNTVEDAVEQLGGASDLGGRAAEDWHDRAVSDAVAQPLAQLVGRERVGAALEILLDQIVAGRRDLIDQLLAPLLLEARQLGRNIGLGEAAVVLIADQPGALAAQRDDALEFA